VWRDEEKALVNDDREKEEADLLFHPGNPSKFFLRGKKQIRLDSTCFLFDTFSRLVANPSIFIGTHVYVTCALSGGHGGLTAQEKIISFPIYTISQQVLVWQLALTDEVTRGFNYL
jgi:hypothetical protein